MYYTQPDFDDAGRPICKICGKSFDGLMQHAFQAHGLTAYEYKAIFNHHPRKGIISNSTAIKFQKASIIHRKVTVENLVKAGRKSRFQKGNMLTDKKKVSKACSEGLKKYWVERKKEKAKEFSDLRKSIINLV